jgi:hypothetical protein
VKRAALLVDPHFLKDYDAPDGGVRQVMGAQ